MDAPTAKEVRERSPLLAGAYEEPADDAALTLLIDVSAPLVGDMTGREIAGTTGEEVPDAKLELARKVIAMKTEGLHAVVGVAEDREDAIDRSRLRSISAGSWSESYWGPGEAAKGKTLDTDPILAELLWALCTEDKRAEWLAQWDPDNAPGFSVIESFDYGRRPGGY